MKAWESDLKESDTATAWWHERYCYTCKAKTGHEEFMTQICLSCGTYSSHLFRGRASRKVLTDEGWKIQHRYEDGSFGYSRASVVSKSNEGIFFLFGLVAFVIAVVFVVTVSR